MPFQEDDPVLGEIEAEKVVINCRAYSPSPLPRVAVDRDVYFERNVFFRFIGPYGKRRTSD